MSRRSEPIDSRMHRGLRVDLYTDHDCSSPRENDNLGTIIAWHRRYQLSDAKAPKYLDQPADFDSGEYAVCLPIYLYDHGGIALSCSQTGQFADRWDAGQLGWIYADRAKLLWEYGGEELTAEIIAKATEVLHAEIEEYSAFVSGECYGYVITDPLDGEELDSCWGFVGYEWVWESAREAADYEAQKRDERADALTDAGRGEN